MNPYGLLERLGCYAWWICTRQLSPRPPPAVNGIELRTLEREELIAHCANAALDVDAQKVQASLGRGELCVGALDASTLVGYAWFACQPAPHTAALWMEFDRRLVYVYRAFVAPGYRGRGIASALYRQVDPLFLARGRTAALLCIAFGNHASLAAAQRSGARVAGYCAYVQAGRLFLHARTRGAIRLGYRFYRPG